MSKARVYSNLLNATVDEGPYKAYLSDQIEERAKAMERIGIVLAMATITEAKVDYLVDLGDVLDAPAYLSREMLTWLEKAQPEGAQPLPAFSAMDGQLLTKTDAERFIQAQENPSRFRCVYRNDALREELGRKWEHLQPILEEAAKHGVNLDGVDRRLFYSCSELDKKELRASEILQRIVSRPSRAPAELNP